MVVALNVSVATTDIDSSAISSAEYVMCRLFGTVQRKVLDKPLDPTDDIVNIKR